jgi:hypothetical protein
LLRRRRRRDDRLEFGSKKRSVAAHRRGQDVGVENEPKEAPMRFQISALPIDDFTDLFAMDDEQLRARGARRYPAESQVPCRVSLRDADIGESVILVPYEHQPADSPYRASGPIYVRMQARPAVLAAGEIPDQLRRRLLSVRGYDRDSWIQEADVVDGRELETAIERFLANPAIDYLHVHYAKPGCYACRIDRV